MFNFSRQIKAARIFVKNNILNLSELNLAFVKFKFKNFRSIHYLRTNRNIIFCIPNLNWIVINNIISDLSGSFVLQMKIIWNSFSEKCENAKKMFSVKRVGQQRNERWQVLEKMDWMDGCDTETFLLFHASFIQRLIKNWHQYFQQKMEMSIKTCRVLQSNLNYDEHLTW